MPAWIRMALAVAWSLDTNKATGCDQDPRHYVASRGNMAHEHKHRPFGCCRTMCPDMVLGNSLSLFVTMTLGGSKDHPDCDGPSGNVAPRPKHGFKR